MKKDPGPDEGLSSRTQSLLLEGRKVCKHTLRMDTQCPISTCYDAGREKVFKAWRSYYMISTVESVPQRHLRYWLESSHLE